MRFFENHGLLKLKGRPRWRAVTGGSERYVSKLTASYAGQIRLGVGAVSVRRDQKGVWVREARGGEDVYDDVVIAAHAPDALAILDDPSLEERALLGACRYTKNRAILHTDRALMPRRPALWASWNYVGDNPKGGCVVSYWMNKLQNLQCSEELFLTLNPQNGPREDSILYTAGIRWEALKMWLKGVRYLGRSSSSMKKV